MASSMLPPSADKSRPPVRRLRMRRSRGRDEQGHPPADQRPPEPGPLNPENIVETGRLPSHYRFRRQSVVQRRRRHGGNGFGRQTMRGGNAPALTNAPASAKAFG